MLNCELAAVLHYSLRFDRAELASERVRIDALVGYDERRVHLAVYSGIL